MHNRSVHHTADFVINNIVWELKTPTGNSSAFTIGHQFERASKQSAKIIIDGRFIPKWPEEKIKRQITYQFSRDKKIGRVLYISKENRVSEIVRMRYRKK